MRKPRLFLAWCARAGSRRRIRWPKTSSAWRCIRSTSSAPFKPCANKGLGEEEIAARFFVAPTVVKQRLRLAAVSEKLLDVYAEDGMTLEQLMAFTVNGDHARQEQVWEGLSRSHNQEPYYIRRQLTDGAVRASDRRARFVGADAYEAAGGVVMRDLFQHDDGGWVQDPALLDRLAVEKLQAEAEALRAEGWKWIAAAPDFPYGHTAGLRRLIGSTIALTEDERASFDALKAENEALEEQYSEADELPDEIDQRFGEIEAALAAFDNRPVHYDPAEIAIAGAFVSIDGEGALRIERGFVRPEDEALGAIAGGDGAAPRTTGSDSVVHGAVITIGGAPMVSKTDTPEEDDAIRPLSDRLVTELTAHHTLALRDALANEPNVAFQAVLHALCLSAFYHHASDTCLEIAAKNSGFSIQAPGLAETASALAIEARQARWAKLLPENSGDLWDALTAFDGGNQTALFAHCAALTVNVVKEPWNRRADAFAHGDQLARAVDLDMVAAGWISTVENYLGRVPKVRIIEAVREAKGEQSARAHRASEEGRHGQGSRAVARRNGLAARAVAARADRDGDRRADRRGRGSAGFPRGGRGRRAARGRGRTAAHRDRSRVNFYSRDGDSRPVPFHPKARPPELVEGRRAFFIPEPRHDRYAIDACSFPRLHRPGPE